MSEIRGINPLQLKNENYSFLLRDNVYIFLKITNTKIDILLDDIDINVVANATIKSG